MVIDIQKSCQSTLKENIERDERWQLCCSSIDRYILRRSFMQTAKSFLLVSLIKNSPTSDDTAAGNDEVNNEEDF